MKEQEFLYTEVENRFLDIEYLEKIKEEKGVWFKCDFDMWNNITKDYIQIKDCLISMVKGVILLTFEIRKEGFRTEINTMMQKVVEGENGHHELEPLLHLHDKGEKGFILDTYDSYHYEINYRD